MSEASRSRRCKQDTVEPALSEGEEDLGPRQIPVIEPETAEISIRIGATFIRTGVIFVTIAATFRISC